MSEERWMDVEAVCRHLGVQPATVYAYASRGQLASRPVPGSRRSEYDPADVERLARTGRRRGPSTDLVLKTALTDTTSGLRYRGHDAIGLAGRRSFEEVAELLWTGELPTTPRPWAVDAAMHSACLDVRAALAGRGEPLDVLRVMVGAAATRDPFRRHLDPAAVLTVSRRLIATVVAALSSPGQGPSDVHPAEAVPQGSVAAALWQGGNRHDDADAVAVLNSALVLLADHGLAPSTLAVRVAAAARTDPYGALLAGLAVVSGARHGGSTREIEAALADGLGAPDPAARVAANLQHGDRHLGLGTELHPEGDPRAQALLEMLGRSASDEAAARWEVLARVLDVMRDRGLPPPTVDLALAAVTTVHDLARGTAETVFAVGRMAGWLAHAMEQYAAPDLIRPRGVYVGPGPQD